MVFLQAIAAILYLGLGLLQFSATVAGLGGLAGIALDYRRSISVLSSLLSSPRHYHRHVRGRIGLGMVLAPSWHLVLRTFCSHSDPFAVILILALISGGVETIISRKRAKA